MKEKCRRTDRKGSQLSKYHLAKKVWRIGMKWRKAKTECGSEVGMLECPMPILLPLVSHRDLRTVEERQRHLTASSIYTVSEQGGPWWVLSTTLLYDPTYDLLVNVSMCSWEDCALCVGWIYCYISTNLKSRIKLRDDITQSCYIHIVF